MAVVLITGTSTGIGLATALHFARKGDDVHAGVRALARATELTDAIRTETLRIRPLVLDVDDQASVERGVRDVLRAAGRVDVLVNNAGIGGGGPLEDVPLDWAKGLFETNYFGALRMIRAVLPGMRERRSGAIVNVSSIAGRVAIAGHGHYSAVKAALEAASEALAQEVLAFGIRVAIVEPGVVVTPIFAKAKRFADPASPYVEHVRRLLAHYQKQMPFAARPADVAEAIYEAVTTARRGSAGWSGRTRGGWPRGAGGCPTRSTSRAPRRCRSRNTSSARGARSASTTGADAAARSCAGSGGCRPRRSVARTSACRRPRPRRR